MFCFVADFVEKKLPKPDLATIRRSVAEAKMLKTSSAAYKKQSEPLQAMSKAGQPPAKEHETEEGTSLQPRKRRAGPTMAPTPAASSPPQPTRGLARLSHPLPRPSCPSLHILPKG